MNNHFLVKWGSVSCLFCLLTVFCNSTGFANDLPPVSETVIPYYETAEIQVDGNIQEPVWENSPWFSGFVSIRGEGLVEQQTAASAIVTSGSLYFAFHFDDENTTTIKADANEHDGRVWLDDSIEVFLQRSEGDAYYHILLNSINTVLDEKNRDLSFEIEAETGIQVGPNNWTAEIRVPLERIGWTLNPEDQFRVSLMRNQPEDGALISSSWTVLRANGHDPERFGIAHVHPADSVPAWKMGDVHPLIPAVNQFSFTTQENELQIQLNGWNNKAIHQQELNAGDQTINWKGKPDLSVALAISDSDGKQLHKTWWPYRAEDWNEVMREARVAKEAEKLLMAAKDSAGKESIEEINRIQKRLSDFNEAMEKPENLSWQEWQRIREESNSFVSELKETLQRISIEKNFPDAPFAVGVCSSMDKVMILDHLFPGRFDKSWNIELAQGEREAFQTAVLPLKDALKGVTVEAGEFRTEDGKLFPAENIQVSLVGHVKTKQPMYGVPYLGWWPDPLLHFQKSAEAKPGETISFWIEFFADEEVTPGNYKGEIIVKAEGHEPVPVSVTMKVWDFQLERPFHLPTAFTFAQNQPQVLHGEKWNDDVLKSYWQALIENGIDVDQIYRGTPPPIDELEYHIEHDTRNFNLLYINRRHIDQQSLTFNKDEEERIIETLREIMPKLKERGWDDKAYLYSFDEVPVEQVPAARKVFERIKKEFPELRIMTTSYDYSWGEDTGLYDYVDIWVPLTTHYDEADALKLRNDGKDMWWYICIEPKDPYANWFVEDPAIESRLLTGAMSAQYQPGGFLYYHTDRWQENDKPITGGPYTDWDPASYKTNNGDGSLLCAGPEGAVQTIRLKNIRDGLEDYEYHHLLQILYDEKKESLSVEQREKVEGLLAVPDNVVHDLVSYTHSSGDVLNWRRGMAEMIVEMQD